MTKTPYEEELLKGCGLGFNTAGDIWCGEGEET